MKLVVALGGRAAEDVVFGRAEVTTGAGGDIQQVASMARQMVTRFGMSELGTVSLEGDSQEVFIGRDLMTRSDISDAIAVYPENEWIVSLELKSESENKFTNLTKKLASNQGEQRKLAIVLDGEVVSAPGIAFDVDPNIGITGGNAAISMGNADAGESANNLATSVILLIFSVRSSAEKPKSLFNPILTLSPSNI